jgi:hypothetical protein
MREEHRIPVHAEDLMGSIRRAPSFSGDLAPVNKTVCPLLSGHPSWVTVVVSSAEKAMVQVSEMLGQGYELLKARKRRELKSTTVNATRRE